MVASISMKYLVKTCVMRRKTVASLQTSRPTLSHPFQIVASLSDSSLDMLQKQQVAMRAEQLRTKISRLCIYVSVNITCPYRAKIQFLKYYAPHPELLGSYRGVAKLAASAKSWKHESHQQRAEFDIVVRSAFLIALAEMKINLHYLQKSS